MATTIANTPRGDARECGFQQGQATVEGVEYKFSSVTYDGINWEYSWPTYGGRGRWITEAQLIERIESGWVPVKNWEGVWES